MAQDQKTKLPNVVLKTLDGKDVNSNTFSNNGKPFAIVVWATWCRPSVNQLSEIQEVFENLVDETGVKIIAISVDDARNKSKVAPLINYKDWGSYEHYIDSNEDFYKAMNIPFPPQTYLFNGKGELVWKKSGYKPDEYKELLEEIKKCSK